MASRMHLIKQIIYMQMLITKSLKAVFLSLVYILASTSVCSANTLFIEQFQTEPLINSKLADRITQYHSENINLPAEQQKSELLNIDKQLEKLQNSYSDKSVYWFIKGLNYKNIASYYDENQKHQLAKSYINNKNIAYEKAIKLNNNNNKLSAAIFSTMKLGLSEDLKISATKKEISLGGNGDNDSYYWYLHWSNIDQLEKAGRKDEAKAAYKQMQKELKNSNMDMSVYSSLTKKIETDTLKQNSKQLKKTGPSKKTQPEARSKPKKYDTKFIIMSTIAVFSVLSIFAVIFYEIRRKRK